MSYKSRTRGVALAALNCGIIVGYRELYNAESLSQIALFSLDLIEHFSYKLPEYFTYDDGCHLKRFINSKNWTDLKERGYELTQKKIYIDRLHMINHKELYDSLHSK